MGQARQVMDRLTELLTSNADPKAIGECYAADAVAFTPDQGEIHGRDKIVEYWRQMLEAVPDSRYEAVHKYEAGDTAIDEGFVNGKNTGPLVTPTGEKLPPTQKELHLRGCDIATVKDGKIVEYRLYFDQGEFFDQLGITPPHPN